jgi:hypothetical protein
MIILAVPCDGMDNSRRWFESHQSFCLFVYIVKLSFRTGFLAVRLWDCKCIYCKITYLSSVLRGYPKSWVAVEKCIHCMSKNTSLIWQISFNGQRCDLQIHHCFLNERLIACSWYIKNRKKPRSWSFYFLFKIFQTRDIIHSEKSGISSDGNRKLGFACWLYKSRWSANVRCRCSPIW